MGRAERRHHRERIKHNRRFHWGRDLRDEPEILSRAVNTPCLCSCRMCGNPRRHFKRKTRKEMKQGPIEIDWLYIMESIGF